MAFRENASDRLARRGHEVYHQQVSGNARVHNGDNNYGLNYEGVNTSLQNLLPRADGAQINSPLREHEPSCLPGTRLNVLQEIKTWAGDGSDKRCVFWLSGMAGTGKSTIARTVAREHLAQNQPGASFFFSRGGGDVGNARKFFTTIAFQLTQRSPALRPGILKAASENLDIGTLQEQWKLLILQPLTLLRPELPQQPLLIVIDALDECEGEQDVRLILQLLASANTHIPNIQLRVLMTSRPDTPIRLGFRENSGIWHRDLVLNEVARRVVDHDIAIYFSKELKDIIPLHDAHTIKRLVEKAGGLFIWAATACRFIKPGQHYAIFAHGRLSHILEGKRGGENPEEKLDQIYAKILLTSVGGDYKDAEKKVLFDLFRRVVGSIAILFDPLSIVALSALLGFSAQFNQTTIEQLLSHLHSVLDVPADRAHPIRLLHPSFRDFLLADERCSEPQLRVDEKLAHRMLADDCLRVMSTSLRRDICGLKRPGSLVSNVMKDQVEQCIRPELQYACLYWVQHLQRGDILLRDGDKVHQFLRLHLLHWLEALAWLRRTSEAILVLISLEGQIKVNKSPSLHEWVRDAKRFALYSKGIIEEAPLQLYCSALIFTPENSIVRKTFEHSIPQWIQTKPKVQPNWSASLQTLEGHTHSVRSVAFSPDGRSVVSGSGDRTVRLWDAATGAPLQTLEGHSDSVSSIAFSPNGRSLVSGSDDTTVRLWDAATGAPLQTLEGHSGWVNSVAFSPDGRSVVSGSRDRMVRLWDAATGAPLQTLDGHSGTVNSVAFSPDGRSVVSGSWQTVRLWDAAMGTPLQTLEGHSRWVRSVAFSPDGRSIVSGSDDETVRLWDAATGAPLQTLEGHSDSVSSVAFSPNGRCVVSGSDDTMVRLWDAPTGAPLQTLEGHPDWVSSVAFSPDGRSVVSGSNDRTVRLWDVATGAPLQTLGGHSYYVTTVAFSPDGRSVVSGSNDRTVRLWDAATGAPLQTLGGHSHYVTSVAFSPDGRSVVSGSNDRTVRLWDAATGAPLQTLGGHSHYVTSVAFSPNGRCVVSGSDDTTVRLWDAATGAPLQTLWGRYSDVNSVAFSPDGRSVVSRFDDRAVQLWDVATGALLQTLEGHADYVSKVAFSPDGRSVLSGSDDETVRLWDAATGAPLQTLDGHSGTVNSVAFWPDGMLEDTLLLSGNWLMEGERKLIWLHPDHRGDLKGAQNGTVVLAQLSGRILIMRFGSGPKAV